MLDPAAQHVIEIYCALAQDESENKSHSIKWGIQAGFLGGTSGYQHFACYGYRFDEEKQSLKKGASPRLRVNRSGTGSASGRCSVTRSTQGRCCSRKPMWRISLRASRRKTPGKGRGTTTKTIMRRSYRWRFLK